MATHSKLPPLDTGIIPLQRLRDHYEHTLLELLDDVDAAEVTLVLTSRVATLLTHVLVKNGLDALKKSRVAECVEITDDVTKVHCHTVVYLSFPCVEEVRSVAMHAGLMRSQSDSGGATPRSLFLYVTGKWTSLCGEVLDQYQLKELFQVGHFPMGFVPLDTDLLTLGHDRCLYDCAVEGNKSSLVDVAIALNQVQEVFGKFEHIKYKGELSMLVLNHMMELSQSLDASSDAAAQQQQQQKRSPMDTLIVLDRRVDYASALCTPLTYEALVDEILHIQDGFISLSPMLLTADPNASDVPMPFALNSTDTVFQQIRAMNIHTIPSVLNAQASLLKTSFKQFQLTSAAASAAEVHEFVKAVPQMKQSQQHLEHHINLLEYLELTSGSREFRDQWKLERAIMDLADDTLEDIQEMVFRHAPLPKVLRLLCLYSVVHDGLPKQELERIKLHLVRTYGHELVFSFDNLERLGLLFEQRAATDSENEVNGVLSEPGKTRNGARGSVFQLVTQTLQVIDLDINIENPKSAAFVTSGYAPISCRLVEEILKVHTWRAIDSVMNHFHGPRAEMSLDSEDDDDTKKKKKKQNSKKKRVVMVCFVGGVTYVEIAALRWLAQFCKCYAYVYFTILPTMLTTKHVEIVEIVKIVKMPDPYELLIAGTSITSGTALVNEALERFNSTSWVPV